jgi:hypothetical protein
MLDGERGQLQSANLQEAVVDIVITISPQYALQSSLFMLIIGGVGQTSDVAISQILNKNSVYRTLLLAAKCLQDLRFKICPFRM